MSEVLLSQLAHVEIISPKPEQSLRWFVDVLGLELTSQEGQSAYLRGWGEWLHSSLVLNEVFWETELYQAPPELRTDMRLRPQRYTGRGAAARYIDHVTINAPQLKDEIAWYKANLGHRHTGSICPEPGVPMFSTLTSTAIRSTHDL